MKTAIFGPKPYTSSVKLAVEMSSLQRMRLYGNALRVALLDVKVTVF